MWFISVCLFVFWGVCLFVCWGVCSISDILVCHFFSKKRFLCGFFPCVTSHRRKAFAEGVEGGIEGSIYGFKKSHKH